MQNQTCPPNSVTINPLSAFDIMYKDMDDATREKLQSQITDILKKSATEAGAILKTSIEKSVTAMYDSLVTNPWIDVLMDCNADLYGFLSSLSEKLWGAMLKTQPLPFAQHNSWKINDLIEAWRKNYPDQFAEVVNAELKDKYNKLKEDYDFILRVEQSRRGF